MKNKGLSFSQALLQNRHGIHVDMFKSSEGGRGIIYESGSNEVNITLYSPMVGSYGEESCFSKWYHMSM